MKFRLNHFFVEVVLCIVGILAASWASSHKMPGAQPSPSYNNSGHCQIFPGWRQKKKRKTLLQVENSWLRLDNVVNFLKWDSMYMCSWKQNLEISHTPSLVWTQPHCLGWKPELKLSIFQFPTTIRKHIFLPAFLLPWHHVFWTIKLQLLQLLGGKLLCKCKVPTDSGQVKWKKLYEKANV